MQGGSFWTAFGVRFGSNASSVDEILEKDEFTLEELLDHEDIIQECKYVNAALIEHLSKKEVLEQLIKYVIQQPPPPPPARSLSSPSSKQPKNDEKEGPAKANKTQTDNDNDTTTDRKDKDSTDGGDNNDTRSEEETGADADPNDTVHDNNIEEDSEKNADCKKRGDDDNVNIDTDTTADTKDKDKDTTQNSETKDADDDKEKGQSDRHASNNSTDSDDSDNDDSDDDKEDEEEKEKESKDPSVPTKYPYVASELIACEVIPMLDVLFDHPELLDLLFSILERDAPIDPSEAAYFRKFVVVLIQHKYEQLVAYFQGKGLIDRMVKHIGLYSIMELLIMIGWDDGSGQINDVQWLYKENLISKLVDRLDPEQETDPEVHANAARALVDVVVKCPPTSSSFLVSHLQSPLILDRIFSNMFSGSSSALTNTLSIIIVLVQRDVNRRAELPNDLDMGFLPPFFDKILSHLPKIMELLTDSSDETERLTQYGVLKPPFGQTRMKQLELLLVLMRSNYGKVNEELVRLGVVPVVLDLFFEYEYNNMLHGAVESILRTLLDCEGDDGAMLKKALFEDGQFIERVLAAYEKNEQQTALAGRGYRLGYMGYLIRTCHAIHLLSSNDASISDHLERKGELWLGFVHGPLQADLEKQQVVLGGHRPTSPFNEDEMQFDNDMGMNAMNQMGDMGEVGDMDHDLAMGGMGDLHNLNAMNNMYLNNDNMGFPPDFGGDDDVDDDVDDEWGDNGNDGDLAGHFDGDLSNNFQPDWPDFSNSIYELDHDNTGIDVIDANGMGGMGLNHDEDINAGMGGSMSVTAMMGLRDSGDTSTNMNMNMRRNMGMDEHGGRGGLEFNDTVLTYNRDDSDSDSDSEDEDEDEDEGSDGSLVNSVDNMDALGDFDPRSNQVLEMASAELNSIIKTLHPTDSSPPAASVNVSTSSLSSSSSSSTSTSSSSFSSSSAPAPATAVADAADDGFNVDFSQMSIGQDQTVVNLDASNDNKNNENKEGKSGE